jgi:hypothetical protein
MTSKCTDQSDPRTADEKLEIATLRNAELTEKELGSATGGRSCCAGVHYPTPTIICR